MGRGGEPDAMHVAKREYFGRKTKEKTVEID